MKHHEICKELGLHTKEDIANLKLIQLFPTLGMLKMNGLEFNSEHNLGPITLHHNFLTHDEARQLIEDELVADDDLTGAFLSHASPEEA